MSGQRKVRQGTPIAITKTFFIYTGAQTGSVSHGLCQDAARPRSTSLTVLSDPFVQQLLGRTLGRGETVEIQITAYPQPDRRAAGIADEPQPGEIDDRCG